MKIINLHAENIKRIVAVDITPGENVVTIAGKNGSGKTSVLDSIWWALAGTTNIQAQPIRTGETKARIRLDLGEIVVERKFTEKGTTIQVTNTEGAKYPSPQKMLDALLGALSFDPLAFCRAKPREQYEELAKIAQLDTDLDALAVASRTDFGRRAEINREAKERRAQAAGIAVEEVAGDSEPVDEKELVDALQMANDANAAAQREVAAKNAAARDHANQIATMELQIADQKKRAAEFSQRAENARRQADRDDEAAATAINAAAMLHEQLVALGPAPPPAGPPIALDVADIRRQIDEARTINSFLAERSAAIARRHEIEARAQELEDQAEDLTKRIDKRKRDAAEAVARAVMPVPGIGFGAGEVLFNGVPFAQASSAEQLRVGMAVAMAANPKLRVVRIQDGSLLDEDSLAEIGRMAGEHDYQVWIERVDSSGSMGFVISDGHVVASERVAR